MWASVALRVARPRVERVTLRMGWASLSEAPLGSFYGSVADAHIYLVLLVTVVKGLSNMVETSLEQATKKSQDLAD